METSTAVADPEVASPENETVTPGAQTEETVEGTGAPESTSQESQEPESTPSPSDEVEAAATHRVLTQMATDLGLEGDFKSYEEIRSAVDAREAAQRDEVIEAEVRSYYPSMAEDVVRTLTGETIDTWDADGNPVKVSLTPEQVQKAFPRINEFRAKVRQLEQQENFNELADNALGLIPETAHDAFMKAVEGKKLPLKDWLAEVNEHAAANTKAWKKREADFAVEKAKYGAEKWTEGNLAPAGQPSQQAGAGNRGLSMTMAQIDAEPTNVWLQRPKDERDRLLNEAHAAANR